MDLQPERGAAGAAANGHFGAAITSRLKGFEDRARAKTDAFHDGPKHVVWFVCQCQADNGAARQGVGKWCAIALEMVLHDQAVRSWRQGSGLGVHFGKVERTAAEALEPIDDGARGGLSS